MKKTTLSFLPRPALWLSLAALSALLHAPASAETHLVRMLNRNATGAMVYEPDFLQIRPGDTVKFLATRSGHDAASIENMMPDGAKPFKGGIDEEIEVSFDVPGLYGVKCLPHYAMGMVMLIQVGDGDARQMLKIPSDVPALARKRFEEILSRR
ncbi:MAG: pseudoazurin [Lautropia sp.]|nr:pseudoazurin [Lautropia sp.]